MSMPKLTDLAQVARGLSSHALREYLQLQVNNKNLGRKGLEQMALMLRWQILKDEKDFLTLMADNAFRFRVFFNGQAGSSASAQEPANDQQPKPRGDDRGSRWTNNFCPSLSNAKESWLYLMMSKSDACPMYLSHTSNLKDRIARHIKEDSSATTDKFAAALFRSLTKSEVPLVAVIDRTLDPRFVSILRAHWMQAFSAAGVTFCGVSSIPQALLKYSGPQIMDAETTSSIIKAARESAVPITSASMLEPKEIYRTMRESLS